MAGFAYPYDPTGLAASNVVTGERYALVNVTNAYRCVIPLYAPFYRNDLSIKHIESGRVLYEGLDYYLGYNYKELSDVTKQSVYGGVFFHDHALTGTIEFTRYHTVGGQYLQRASDMAAYLALLPMVDPRNVDFSAIMKWPRVVEPIEEPTTLGEALAVDPVVRALDNLTATLTRLNAEEKTKYKAIFTRLNALTTKIREYEFASHEYGADPHAVSYDQLSALGKDQIAKDALTAYGKTLAQLTVLINSMGITPANVEQYYKLLGGAFEGRISFTEGSTCTIQNEAGTSYINIATGQINIQAISNISVLADSDKNETGVSQQLQAGNNTLHVHSSGAATNKNYAMYNGYYLIHVGNIGDYVKSSQTVAGFDLYIDDSTTVDLAGKGTATNPLTGTVTFPMASTTNIGFVQTTDVINSPSVALAASAAGLLAVSQLLDTYALETTTINGHALSADFSLTKADIGLSNVDNTGQWEKPASTPFKTAIAGKSLLGHKHTLADMTGVPVADTDTLGITKLATSAGTSITDAATPGAAVAVQAAVDATTASLDLKLDSQLLPVIEWGKYTLAGRYAGVYVDSIVGWVITLHALRAIGDYWEIVQLEIDLEQSEVAPLINTTLYLYLTSNSDSFGLTASNIHQDDTEVLSYIGYARTNATTAYSVVVAPVYRIINNAELLRHIDEVPAHGHPANDPGYFGLGTLENKGLVHTVERPTFAQVFNNWYRFSHSGNVYPANAAETTSWAYTEATDSISSTTNSATYIGFISQEAIGDFIFDTAVSSTNTDDDTIGVVIGFYKDPTTGKENTLSLLRALSRDSAGMTWSIRLTYNMYQPDAWDIELAGAKLSYGWSTSGEFRIRAIRSGDVYSLEMYGSTVYQAGALEWTRTLDLNSDPRLAVFKGSTRFGYSCHSQANSTFRSIVRPDEDGRNFYASEWAVRELLANTEARTAFTQGTIAHGGTIPIPVGFTAAQCKFHVVPRSLAVTGTAMEQFSCYADATGLVFVQAKHIADGTWITGTANYYLFGAK